jgi:predicted MPP superfamily phosphohydrolase
LKLLVGVPNLKITTSSGGDGVRCYRAPPESPLRLNRSFLTVLAVLFALHAYIGWRLLPAMALGPTFSAIGIVLLAVSGVLIPTAMLGRSIERQPLSDRLSWAGMLTMGLFSSLLVLTVLREVALLLSWLVLPSLRSFDHWSAIAVPVLALVATLIGLLNARRRAAVVDVDVPIAGLPAALHGFSIAQISDIHVGPTIKRGYVEAIVKAVNDLHADVIAVTGDLVDGSVQQLAPHVAPLAQLRARHGAYFVTGNHEYYSGERGWTQQLRLLGLQVLLNQHVVIDHDGKSLVLAGVTDFGAHHFDSNHRSDPAAALAGAPAHSGPKILLAHQPRTAPAAAAAGFDLQLSGHTHGGQFWPWNHFVRFQQPFTAGLHRLNRLWIYVSRGTGYWGPPKRFGAPSEITRIRLVPQPA